VGGDKTIQLSWQAPASTGGAPVSYSVYRSTSPGAEVLIATGLTTPAFPDHAGLTDGTLYYYRVTAMNKVGIGPVSNEVSVIPVSALVATAPLNLVAATATKRGVALTWSPPTSNGGSNILQYRIFRGPTPGAETLQSVAVCTTATCTFTDATAHLATFDYKVAAFTAKGVGAISNEASALGK
jgi:titin